MKLDKRHLDYLLLFFVLILFTVGCSKNEDDPDRGITVWECHSLANQGEIELASGSKSFVSYPAAMLRLILKDSSNQEYVGTAFTFDWMHSFYGPQEPCLLDSTVFVEPRWHTEAKGASFTFNELNFEIGVEVSVELAEEPHPDKGIADICHLTFHKSIGQEVSDSKMSIIVASRDHPAPEENYSDFHETYEINGTEYNNVYVGYLDEDENVEVHYNIQRGILRIKSEVEPALDLFFDRIEF